MKVKLYMRELYQLWSSALNEKQIIDIFETAHKKLDQKAKMFSADDSMQGIRSSKVRWISDEWIQNLLWEYVKKANINAFNIDVQNDAEIQFTEYHSDQADHYGWHHDIDWNGQILTDRKISVTVQLSDVNEYEGGDFEFDEVKTNANFKSKGTVLVFPSYLRHRILPVTSGIRYSLVAWFSGSRWR